MKQDDLARECPHQDKCGVWTSFDPDGARRKLNLPARTGKGGICWNCWDEWGAKIAEIAEQEVLAEMKNRDLCGFLMAWIGHCFKEAPCPDHKDMLCWVCGKPATQDCDDTSQGLVCGRTRCNKHPHNHLGMEF